MKIEFNFKKKGKVFNELKKILKIHNWNECKQNISAIKLSGQIDGNEFSSNSKVCLVTGFKWIITRQNKSWDSEVSCVCLQQSAVCTVIFSQTILTTLTAVTHNTWYLGHQVLNNVVKNLMDMWWLCELVTAIKRSYSGIQQLERRAI